MTLHECVCIELIVTKDEISFITSIIVLNIVLHVFITRARKSFKQTSITSEKLAHPFEP